MSGVDFGDRLGVGSFGATYRAKYRGKSAVVKIMYQPIHKSYTDQDLKPMKVVNPAKFFSAIQSYFSRISVGLLSYDSRSTLIRLDQRKK